jgi:hypothetical protein
MPKPIQIDLLGRRDDGLYVAKANGEEFLGGSPDESLGCAIRELSLTGEIVEYGGVISLSNVFVTLHVE